MRRTLSMLLIVVLLLALAAPVFAQQPAPTAPAPAAENAPQRSPNFDYFIAFGGMGLVLLIVCYSSRRY